MGLADLNADGTEDYGATVSGSVRLISVRSGATGAQLWGLQKPSSGFLTTLDGVADVSGDHRPDVLVSSYGFDSGSLLGVYSGGTGTPVWTSAAGGGQLLGDVDRDGVADIETDIFDVDSLLLTVRSGRTGKVLWTHREGLPQRESTFVSLWWAGDLDGDGVTDVLLSWEATGGGPTLRRDVAILGATGRTRPVPHDALPLGAPLVGREAALLQSNGSLTVSAGTLDGLLWRRHYPVAGSPTIVFADYGRLSGTRGNDLLLTTFGGGQTDVLALTGSNGTLRWRLHDGG